MKIWETGSRGSRKAPLRKGYSGKVLKKGTKGACRSLGGQQPGQSLEARMPRTGRRPVWLEGGVRRENGGPAGHSGLGLLL